MIARLHSLDKNSAAFFFCRDGLATLWKNMREMETEMIRKWVSLTILVLVLALAVSPALAVNRNISLDSLGFDRDIWVGAPGASFVTEFPLPPLARVRSASALLAVTPGPQLHADNVFLFYFNDRLVATRTARELRREPRFSLPLPPSADGAPVARLRIQSNLYMSEDRCRDLFSGGLFFTVHRDTALRVDYDLRPVRTVADFFDGLQQTVLVVAPNGAELAEVTPAAWTYSLLRKQYPQLDVRLVRAADLSKLPPVPRIWVGMTSRLPAYFKNAAAGMALVDPNTLLISAVDAPTLKSYVRELAELPIFALNPATSQLLSVQPAGLQEPEPVEAMPFGNHYAQEGIVTVPVDFSLYPALLSKPPERLGLHIEGTYTVSPDSLRPVRLDIFMNNSLVYSSMLDQTGQFKKDVLLPNALELRTRNTLGIQFHYPEETGQCRIRGMVQSVQIFPQSYMWGAGQYRFDRFAWNNIGVFFNRVGSVLVDERLGDQLLPIIAESAYFIERQLPQGSHAFPEILPLTAEAPVGNYVLAVGMAERIPQSLQERMPVSVGRDFTLYRRQNRTTLFEYQAAENLVVGRIGDWNGFPLVIMSANRDAALLSEALRRLNRGRHYDDLTGNLLVYRPEAPFYSLDIREKGINIEKPAARGLLTELWEENQTVLKILGSVLLVLGLGWLVFRVLFPRKKAVPTKGNDHEG